MKDFEKLIREMKFKKAIEETRKITDDFWKTQIITNILSEAIRVKDADLNSIIDEISEISMMMENNKYRALKEISIILAKANMFEKAIEIVNLIGKPEYKVETMKLVAFNIASIMDNINKQALFEKLIFVACKIRQKEFKIEALTDIIECLISMKDFTLAIKTTNKIDDEKAREIALSNIASGYADNRNYEKAIETINTIKKSEYKSFVLRSIIGNLAKEDNFTKSYIFADLLTIANTIKNDYEKANTLRDMAVSMAINGEFEKAIEITNSIELDFWKSDSLMYISIEFAKRNMFDEAINISEKIEDNIKKIRSFQNIAECLHQQGLLSKEIEIRKKFHL